MARYTCRVAHNDDDWTKGVPPEVDRHGENEILGCWEIVDIGGGGATIDLVTHAYADVDTSAIGSRTIIKAALKWSGEMTTSHARMTPAYIIDVGNEELYNSNVTPAKTSDLGFWFLSFPLTALAIAEINGHGKTGVTFRTNKPTAAAEPSRWHKWSIIAREFSVSSAVQLLVETAERRYRCTVR